MSDLLKKYNRSTGYTFRRPQGFTYKSLKELLLTSDKMVHRVNAFYINTKSRYGNAPVVATDECFVNLPSHLLRTVEEMMNDDELTEAINQGRIGFTIYEYKGKNGLGYSVNWKEI